MADDRTQINVRVEDSQHERWKGYVEDSDEYRHLSELIRHSVQKEIAGDHDSDAPAQQAAGGDDIDQVLEALEQLGGRFDSVEATVQSAAEEMRSSSGVSDETLTTVFETLPDSVIKAKTAADVAKETGVSEDDAAVALAKLRQEMGVSAQYPDDADDMSYWKGGN